MKQYDNTAHDNVPLKHLPEPVKAPFLTLEDKQYAEYYVKRWNDIAGKLSDADVAKLSTSMREYVFKKDLEVIV